MNKKMGAVKSTALGAVIITTPQKGELVGVSGY